MARLIKRTQNNYTNVSNQVIRDERLSWKARGIIGNSMLVKWQNMLLMAVKAYKMG